ncbi:MAG: sigma-E processing peptidase SpoIIGA [Clostridia bacterium]|nr:sigma-E processing peptidase SpoIIGA [Clostridia bacterium]
MYFEDGVIYADIYFVINFCIDFLCLFITGRLNRRGAKTLRTLAAALFGSVYAFLPYLFPGLPVYVLLPMHVAAAAVVCMIAFGVSGGAKKFALVLVSFFTTEALMGGLVSGIYGLVSNGEGLSRAAFAPICVISALAALFYGLICRNKSKTRVCELRFTVAGETVRARLIVDSGNLVTEPFSALPVIVLSHSVLPPPLDSPDVTGYPVAVRMIPFETGAGKGCLFGFRPEKAEVIIPANKPREVKAFIGVDTERASYSGYDGLLPAELI